MAEGNVPRGLRSRRLAGGAPDRRVTRAAMAAAASIGVLAIYYSTLAPDALRAAAAIGFGTSIAVALLWLPLRWAAAMWALGVAAVLVWYAFDRPRNDRVWAPEYAIVPEVSRAGDRVTIRRIRNFAYRTPTDPVPAYYDSTFPLDDLISLDLVTSYWSGDLIAHVFLSFGFRDGRYLAFSIETRRQQEYAYSSLAGFFHHYELFYVVADERDLIGVRTDVRRERVYLYRVQVSKQTIRMLFSSYLDKVAKLAERPEWYNTLNDNCTTGILARIASEPLLATIPYTWRVLLPGYAAQDGYRRGLLNSALPFDELRRRSRIVRPLGAKIGSDYSHDIRRGLPL